jgi:hypothetical protein
MADNDKDFDSEDENKPMKIVFAEGCFDDFDGTQEELDALVAQLTEWAESGELFDKSIPVDDLEEVDEEVLEEILPMLTSGNVRH